MKGGTVSGCTFIGIVAGKRNDTNDKLVGNHTAGDVSSDNNTTSVIYNDVE